MRIISILFAAGAFIVFGCISLGAQTTTDPAKVLPSDTMIASAAAKNDRYRIGFQDVLNIQVFRHPDLNQTVPVSPNGTIILFRLDRPVIAVCKTERELATEIAGAYSG